MPPINCSHSTHTSISFFVCCSVTCRQLSSDSVQSRHRHHIPWSWTGAGVAGYKPYRSPEAESTIRGARPSPDPIASLANDQRPPTAPCCRGVETSEAMNSITFRLAVSQITNSVDICQCLCLCCAFIPIVEPKTIVTSQLFGMINSTPRLTLFQLPVGLSRPSTALTILWHARLAGGVTFSVNGPGQCSLPGSDPVPNLS